MDFSDYFKPVSQDITAEYGEQKTLLGNIIAKHTAEGGFPELTDGNIAIIGVPEERNAPGNKGCADAPDKIREKLYHLKASDNYPYKIADLGNLNIGHTVNDTYAAIATILSELLRARVVPVIIGGSQDLTLAQYLAYQKLEETVNIVGVDARFDLGVMEDKLRNNTYIGKIILQEPNFLFNFSNIGYQTYFTGYDQIELMQKLFFDAYRLGEVRQDMEEVEPIIRNADMLSFDMTAIRQSDAPGNANATPNGFYGEEACRIMRYAGMSDKMSCVGIYEVNPHYDGREQTSHLAAQMLWYFIEGYYNRKNDQPLLNKSGFVKYHVTLRKNDHEIVFYKSKNSGRWWMEVPFAGTKAKYQRHHLVPCSYKDYEAAMQDELPERWWQALQKMS